MSLSLIINIRRERRVTGIFELWKLKAIESELILEIALNIRS